MKKIIIPIIIIAMIIVLFAPLHIVTYKDGGTTAYTSLTYKVVKWNRINADSIFDKTDIYFFPDNFKNIDSLWSEEKAKLVNKFQGVVRELNDTTAIVEPFAEEEERRSSDRISFNISNFEKMNVAVDDIVEVTYKGDITETYPAGVNAIGWELVIFECDDADEPAFFVAKKPVIYLYPKKETNVSVSLSLKGKLTCAYPKYEDMWQVTAKPDGTLTDKQGQTYNYLYWEGETKAKYDFSQGFCVKGEDTAKFLESALEKLGLNRKEANEFIVYWLPLMQDNPYNVISFQTDAYTDNAKLNINPVPDTLIRVFMAYKPVNKYQKIKKQELVQPERNGFVAVEWGGAEVK